MWTVFRFSLSGGDARAYRDALEILVGAGFRRAAAEARIDWRAPFPAAVLANVERTVADVTRVIFATLAEAGLRPVAVSGCPLSDRAPAEHGGAAA